MLASALRAHFDCLLSAGAPFPVFQTRPQPPFRFSRTTVFLMIVIFGGVVLAIRVASSVAGDTLGSVWATLGSVLLFMLWTMCATAAIVLGILHCLRRGGLHRLENIHRHPHSLESRTAISNGREC